VPHSVPLNWLIKPRVGDCNPVLAQCYRWQTALAPVSRSMCIVSITRLMPGVDQSDPPGLIHDDPRLLPPWRGSSLLYRNSGRSVARRASFILLPGSCGIPFSHAGRPRLRFGPQIAPEQRSVWTASWAAEPTPFRFRPRRRSPATRRGADVAGRSLLAVADGRRPRAAEAVCDLSRNLSEAAQPALDAAGAQPADAAVAHDEHHGDGVQRRCDRRGPNGRGARNAGGVRCGSGSRRRAGPVK
jgi:hypothetical protein